MQKINNIVIHHSASSWGNAFAIDKWHKANDWTGIGYHFVILNGYPNSEDYKKRRLWKPLIGQIECGRSLDLDPWIEYNEEGAHCLGFNDTSVGICLVHDKGDKYHYKMMDSLIGLCQFLILQHSELEIDKVYGHYQLNKNKSYCPGFDVIKFREKLKDERPNRLIDIIYSFLRF